MKTAEDFIREMESSNVLMTRECTFNEYVAEMLQFQSVVCKLIAGDVLLLKPKKVLVMNRNRKTAHLQ